jgi:hypothetical protein
VQALPSLHAVPFAATGLEHAPLDGSHVPAAWHWSLAAQVTGFEPVHAPLWQESVWVHALLSLHVVPFAATGLEHAPLDGSHVPATWHWSLAVHVTGLEPVQLPFWHASLCVQALPSLQAVPFAATGFEHAPLDGSHVPTAWHWSLAVHVTGLEPAQVPFWQESTRVQALPSLHVVPFAATGFEHAPLDGSHVPATWHWSLAAHVTGLEPLQLPFWHESLCVQALPSLQVVPLAAIGLEHVPLAGSQVPAT